MRRIIMNPIAMNANKCNCPIVDANIVSSKISQTVNTLIKSDYNKV